MNTRERIHEALANAFSTEGVMLTRFYVVAEVIEANGDQALHTVASDGLPRWDTLGMLDYALTFERRLSGVNVTDTDDEPFLSATGTTAHLTSPKKATTS